MMPLDELPSTAEASRSTPQNRRSPSASTTALIAGSLFIFNNSPVRAAADAMWCREEEEEAPPALAA